MQEDTTNHDFSLPEKVTVQSSVKPNVVKSVCGSKVKTDKSNFLYSMYAYHKEPLSDPQSYYLFSWRLDQTNNIFSKIFNYFAENQFLRFPTKMFVCKHIVSNLEYKKWNIMSIKKANIPYFTFYLDSNYVCHIKDHSLDMNEALPSLIPHSLFSKSLKTKNKKELVTYSQGCCPYVYEKMKGGYFTKNNLLKNIIIHEMTRQT